MANTSQEVGPRIVELLGLPKGTIWFELRCAVNEMVTVKCEYYPDVPQIIDGEMVKLFAEYELEKKND